MTMDVDNAQSSMPRDELVELLENLRFVKRRSIPFLERWAAETADVHLRNGLTAQIGQDRQILDALTGRMQEMGERPNDDYRDEDIEEAFRALEAVGHDVVRLAGFHRALKQYLIARYNMLLALADPGTREIMEDLDELEERMQRWGETQRASVAIPVDAQAQVIEIEAQIQTLTARSRERMARDIRERAEAVTGGVVGKRMGEMQEQLAQFLAQQQPPAGTSA